MPLPQKIEKWITADAVPQRLLLSGHTGAIETALEIAAKLQGLPVEKIASGAHADTLVFRDVGKSFKIDFSDAAKRDGQSPYENVRGLIRWAHQKPEAAHRLIVLENLERITAVAPHAMLKLIEEPPARTRFLLTTRNHHKLLDTIISRVTLVRLAAAETQPAVSEPVQRFFAETSVLKRFQLVEELDKTARDNAEKKIDRAMLQNFVEESLRYARAQTEFQRMLEPLLETHTALGMNLNPKFCLERLVLKFAAENRGSAS